MKANKLEQLSLLHDATRLFASENNKNAANMPKSSDAAPCSSVYLGIPEKAGLCRTPATATNYQPQALLIVRVVAGTREFHLQLQQRNISENSLSNLRFYHEVPRPTHSNTGSHARTYLRLGYGTASC